jgi:hypothetical protein
MNGWFAVVVPSSALDGTLMMFAIDPQKFRHRSQIVVSANAAPRLPVVRVGGGLQPSDRPTMIGGTPAAAAIRVSPAPCVTLKSICFRSAPTTVTSAPAPRKTVRYAFARLRGLP